MIKAASRSKPTVIVRLPRVGLGNCLLVWARAAVFAQLNDLPMQTFGWKQVRVGPWLRGERTKRFYGRYFRSAVPLWRRVSTRARFLMSRPEDRLRNPAIEKLDAEGLEQISWVVFDEMPDWKDWFRDLKPHRAFVRERLAAELHPRIAAEVAACARPTIGVHVRLGDARSLQPGEDFAKIGGRTPETHFIEAIRTVRAGIGRDAPVTIFSDGYPHELRGLLNEPSTSLSPQREDIVDMLLLSRSDVIVVSALSSFSYWAGFLSDAPLILHPDHIYQPIRSEHEGLYEGPASTNAPALIAALTGGAGRTEASPALSEAT